MRMTLQREKLLRKTLGQYQKQLLNHKCSYEEQQVLEKRCVEIMDSLGMDVSSFYRHVPARLNPDSVQLSLFDLNGITVKPSQK